MHPVACKLFFTDRVVVKNSYSTSFEAEGLFLNWFGGNLYVAVGVWWSLMLALQGNVGETMEKMMSNDKTTECPDALSVPHPAGAGEEDSWRI